LHGQTRAIAKFYRGEAALLAAEAAARLAPQPRQSEPPLRPANPAPAAPPISLPEPDRPPLAPQPALNQNVEAPPPAARRAERRRPRLGRTLAWVVLAPWYAAMAVASVGVDVLFVKGLLGF
jgi:hypothetical protein